RGIFPPQRASAARHTHELASNDPTKQNAAPHSQIGRASSSPPTAPRTWCPARPATTPATARKTAAAARLRRLRSERRSIWANTAFLPTRKRVYPFVGSGLHSLE